MKDVKDEDGWEIQFATTQHEYAKCLSYLLKLPVLYCTGETVLHARPSTYNVRADLYRDSKLM